MGVAYHDLQVHIYPISTDYVTIPWLLSFNELWIFNCFHVGKNDEKRLNPLIWGL